MVKALLMAFSSVAVAVLVAALVAKLGWIIHTI